MKRRIRFLIAATLLVSLALPSFAGAAKRGWTKVQLTHANGDAKPFPPGLLKKAGGEMLVDYSSHAVGYVPNGALASLQAAAREEGITVAARDDFDVMRLPSSARVDAREGISDDVPKDERIREYPARRPGLFLIQFVAPARKEWIAELTSMGWTMARYIPTNGYIIAGGPELAGRTRQLPYIQFLDFFHPYQKAKQLVRDGAPRDIVFELSSAPDPSDAIEAIRAAAENGVEVHRGATDTLVFTRMAHDKAEPLLHHPLVISMTPRPVGAFSDERQAMSLTTNLNSSASQPTTPNGYTTWLSGRCPTCSSMSASSWRIGLADTGLDDGTNAGGHPDLAGRKYFGSRLYAGNHDNCVAGNLNCDDVSHGTIVAGLMVGNASTGVVDPLGFQWGMGVAPWAGVFSTKVASAAAGTQIDMTRLFEFTRDAALNGVTIQNHSFNEYITQPNQSGLYSTLARQYDIAVRDADGPLSSSRTPILIAVSAGNNNQGINDANRPRVLGGGTAKNVLSMGGAENYRPGVTGCNAPGDDFRNIMATSRTGTLLPGYIKPDLVAPAAPIGSTNSSEITSDNSYCIDGLAQFEPINGVEEKRFNGDSGTSFAAPVGAAASLIVKRYLGSTPSETSPALAKAMLIAGAKSIRGGIDKAANPDVAIGAFPNGQQGFGRVSFDDIITGSTQPVWYDQATVRTFDSETHPFSIRLRVRDASKPVKVALVWTDAPGTANVEQPLVNDLDLEVYRSTTSGYRYHGNYLQVTDTDKGEESVPVWVYEGVEGRDRTNNVEVVRSFMTTNEEFDVKVNGYFIWGDTDGNTNTFEQDFALVVTNADKVNAGNPIAPTLDAYRSVDDPRHLILTWTPAANIMNLRYEVWRGTNLGNMTKIVPEALGNGWNEYDMPLDTTFIYRVVAIGNGGVSAASNNATATTIDWWPDNFLNSQLSPIKAQHWTDLRRGVDYVRTAAGLATNTWADSIASSGFIKAAQLTELRTKLLQAYTTLGVPAPTFTTPAPTSGVTFIKPADVIDLREAIE
jgi:serine protease AprX